MKPFVPPLRKGVVRMFGISLLACLLTSPLFGAGVTVRITGDSGGERGRFAMALAEEWAQKTGNKVEYIGRPSDASATLQI
jgi:trehalose/maltose transport system substrate-binding protein